MNTTPKSGNYLDFEKDLPRTRAIDNLRKFSVGFKRIYCYYFLFSFLSSFSLLVVSVRCGRKH